MKEQPMPTPEMIDKLETLTGKVSELSEQVSEAAESNRVLARSNRKQRNWLVALGCIGLVVALVVVAVVVALVKVDDAADKANSAAAQALTAQQATEIIQRYQSSGCVEGNKTRKLEKAIWDVVFSEDAALAEAEGEQPSKREQQALDKIMKTIEKAYPQRDCEKVKEGEVVNLPSTTGKGQ